MSHRYLLSSPSLWEPWVSERPERQRGPGRQGGRASRRRVNALLAESQMAANMLCRLGKHWQIHPQSHSGCQLEDITVFGVLVQEAEQSWKVRPT